MKRRIALGFVLALCVLAVLLFVIGGHDVLAQFQRADRRFLALGVCSGLLALTFRGIVWERFLAVVDRSITRRRIAAVFLTAMFIKYVTPYGQLATEPFVAYLVARGESIAFEDGLAGVLSADLLNYVPYYTFGFLALGAITIEGTLGDGLGTQLIAFSGVFLALVAIVAVAIRRPKIVYRLVLTLTNALHRLTSRFTTRFDDHLKATAVRARLDGFYESLEQITTDRPTLLVAVLAAHLGMAFLMLPVYFGGLAIGYELALPIVALVVALGKLGSVVPAPGGTAVIVMKAKVRQITVMADFVGVASVCARVWVSDGR